MEVSGRDLAGKGVFSASFVVFAGCNVGKDASREADGGCLTTAGFLNQVVMDVCMSVLQGDAMTRAAQRSLIGTSGSGRSGGHRRCLPF